MNCQHCYTTFVPEHGNERFCTEECRTEAQKVYIRQYRRKQRGAGKDVYKISKAGSRYFFVLPTHLAKILTDSQVDWYVSFQDFVLTATIARIGNKRIYLTGSQYRVYLEKSTCIRFDIANTYRQWGITFSTTGDKIFVVAKMQENAPCQKKK
jgi:hypothetical protein